MDPLPHPPQLPPPPQPFHLPPFQQQHPPTVAISASGTVTTAAAAASTNNAAALPTNNYNLVAQVAGAANPANLPPPTPPTSAPAPVNHPHPPYTEMIFAAITALKEKDGSSKRAIAKYIEKAYAGLPPTHSALLTHHLKRLKNTGLLVMVKKSYMLPRSDLTNNIAATLANLNNNQSQPQPLSQNQLVGPANTSPTGPLKRGRGRPPKPKPNGQQQPSSSFGGQDQHVVSPDPISVVSPPVANGQQQPQTVTVSIGIADQQQLIKRRPGRPSKKMLVGQGGGSLLPVKRGRGRPPKSVAVGRPKKSAGRPRKPKSVAAASNGVKRRPGRPPKASSQPQQQSVPVPFAVSTGGVASASAPTPASASAAVSAAAAAAAAPAPATAGGVNVPKPRGRPRKAAVPAAATAAVGVVPVKRPGRPPRAGGIVKPKKSTGRPVGRPRRKDASPGVAGAPQSQLQAEAHTDLKRKLEFFQSRVKEAVGILKPHLTNEIAIGAVAAIQSLEGLASMDINKPLSSEPQPLLQAQPLLLNSQPSALQS